MNDRPLPSAKSTSIAILVAGAFFMENLDGTIIATALPQIGRSFHVNPVDLNIGMTAYLLMLAVFIPISGWFADRFGARTVFVSAIAVFTLSSILCGLSNGLWQFTASRVLQGIGGAMMVPVGRLVVLRTTEKHNLIHSITYITWPGLVAPVVGPPVGGFITTYASWHWIFFLNVPLGLVAIVLAALWVPNSREDQVKPFDWLGFALCGTACVTFVYGLELIGRQNTPWLTTSLYLGCGFTLGVLAILHFRRAPAPVINLISLKMKTFAITIGGGSLFRSVSASTYVSSWLRTECISIRPFDAGSFCRQSGNENRHDSRSEALRFPLCADRKWNSDGSRDACLLCADVTHAADCDSGRIVREWLVPVDAVYKPQHHRLCRHSEAAVELRHELLQHGDAAEHGNGSGGRRHRVTNCRAAE